MAEKRKWGFLTWLIIFFLNELAITFLVVPQNWFIRIHESEKKMVYHQMGEEALKKSIILANKYFNDLFIKTNLVKGSYWYTTKSKGDLKKWKDGGLRSWYKKRIDVFWTVIWQVLFRFFSSLVWIPCIFLFTVPLIIDATLQREIRKYSFTYASPLINQQANKFIKIIFLLMLSLPIIPLPIPPMLLPIIFAFLSITLWLLISNMQKRT